MYEKKVGKKVWELEGEIFRKAKKETAYEVKAVKSPKECGDYCYHYVISDAEGNEKEVRELDVVFAFDGKDINRYLSDNDLYAEDICEESENIVNVSISWGDWKHEHMWCRILMEYIGFDEIGEMMTEENGSDCYSATHFFIKAA